MPIIILVFLIAGTAWAQADSDADGMPDQWELQHPCLNPLAGDSLLDSDSDTIKNLAEFGLNSDPCAADTDHDGLSDPAEIAAGTMISFWDTDLDGLPDGYEAANPPLDPLMDEGATTDSDHDGNPDVHEFWNGSDPWTPNPVGEAGCYFWGDANGDGYIGPPDHAALTQTLKGLPADYSNVIPGTGETQDLNADTYYGPPDLALLSSFLKAQALSDLPSRPAALERIGAAAVSVKVGDTTPVAVGLRNGAGLLTTGFGVVFSIDPASTGAARILGGDGASGSSRYDVSGSIPGGAARVIVRVDSPGEIYINVAIPQCGADLNHGRYCSALQLDHVLTITGESDACQDNDYDGFYTGCVDYVNRPGPDCNDSDPNNWNFCATCADTDTDGRYVGCDRYLTIAGPDCDDIDPNNWTACATCADADVDGYYAGCDRYQTIAGPDCGDADPNNWTSCAACLDLDADGYYAGCNRYLTINGPDCGDTDPNNWTACGACRDLDADGWFAGCNRYLTINGPDCGDTDPNNWAACAACRDTDADGWFAGCNRYQTITGPDCNDSDLNNWNKCAVCLDLDADGYYAGCNRYLTLNGPDCGDADPNNWTACAVCLDLDADGYYAGCDRYLTINGPDCGDTDPNNWAACAACKDLDGDAAFVGCDRYLTVTGPDCGDTDPNNWTSCAACLDLDADGWFAGCNRYQTITGPDCNDSDLNNWDMCATCRDTDADSWFAGCNSFQTIIGPDCSDSDPNNWEACAACRDVDVDAHYTGCDRYLTIAGPDCNDRNPNSWTHCSSCRDLDADLHYFNCDAYVTVAGPDCNDYEADIWDTCATCVDVDGDGYYLDCNQYTERSGPDCNDSDLNNWDHCATCRDTDADGWFVGCNGYYSILGPDCGDADADNWDLCATCVDADSDGFYAGCNRYNTRLGPDRNDWNASYTSAFIITVANPGSGYAASLSPAVSDNSLVTYPGLTARWVNPSISLQNLSVSPDGSVVTFTIHSNAAAAIPRIWMFAWARSATMTSAPRLTNNRGDRVFVIGPIEGGGNRTYTLSASGFNASGYKFYIDFIRFEQRVAFTSNRINPTDPWGAELFSGDSSGQDLVQSVADPASYYNMNADWSAGGEWIAYTRGGYSTCITGSTVVSELRPQIYIVHPDGSNRRLVSAGSYLSNYFTFNPQGTVIAYDCRPDCHLPDSGICTYNLRTGERSQILSGSGSGYYMNSLYQPRWSPNGDYIVFMANDVSRNEYWFYAHLNPNTGEPLETPKYFMGSAPILYNQYYFKSNIMDWAWAPDSLHAAVTIQRTVCWCLTATPEADSKNLNCDLPGKPAACAWRVFGSSYPAFPKSDGLRGIGIVNFADALNATTLPILLGFNRLGAILSWVDAYTDVNKVYHPAYYPENPVFKDSGTRLYYNVDEGSGKSSIRSIKLTNYAYVAGTVLYYLPSSDPNYNQMPALFPPALNAFFPIPP